VLAVEAISKWYPLQWPTAGPSRATTGAGKTFSRCLYEEKILFFFNVAHSSVLYIFKHHHHHHLFNKTD